MLTLVVSVLIPVSLVLLFRFLNERHKPPILGVYQQKNKYYWHKFTLMYIVLVTKQLLARAKRFYAVEKGTSCDGTIHVHQEDVALEEKYDLGEGRLAVDAVYFNGMSKDGDAIMFSLARRQQRACDAFLYLKLKGEDLLLSPSMPDTRLEQVETDGDEYSVDGMKIIPFIPMRTWKLSYKGQMKPRNNPEKRLNVEVSVTWSAHWAPFNYDTNMAPRCLAASLAREAWSRDYFKLLKKIHETHYEQMGHLRGTVTVDGKEHAIHMPCARDRSYGQFRDWRTLHRYVYHFIFLENGDCIAVGAASQPVVLSELTIGYVCNYQDQTVLPVTSSDFRLYQHAENQVVPKDYAFTFKAGGESYVVRVEANDQDEFYIGAEREAKFYERWGTVQVNGVKGWACIEWQYNNVQDKK